MFCKCPKCEKPVTHVNIGEIEGRVGMGGSKWHCVSYSCPLCFSVLSVQIDPIAIRTDTINAIKAR